MEYLKLIFANLAEIKAFVVAVTGLVGMIIYAVMYFRGQVNAYKGAVDIVVPVIDKHTNRKDPMRNDLKTEEAAAPEEAGVALWSRINKFNVDKKKGLEFAGKNLK
jgi:hypothetical protein